MVSKSSSTSNRNADSISINGKSLESGKAFAVSILECEILLSEYTAGRISPRLLRNKKGLRCLLNTLRFY